MNDKYPFLDKRESSFFVLTTPGHFTYNSKWFEMISIKKHPEFYEEMTLGNLVKRFKKPQFNFRLRLFSYQNFY